MFKTFEELKEKYPIGTKVNHKQWTTFVNLPYNNKTDLIIYREEYGEVEVLDENYCKVRMPQEKFEVVEGYLFNGENWCLVKNTWDGWVEIEVVTDV